MRKLLFAGLVALIVPTASRAQVRFGVRLGYAGATGEAFKDKSGALGAPGESFKMSDGVPSQIPIQVDASYKIDKDWAAGLYMSYGFGQVGGALAHDLCTSGIECSASTMRLGAQGSWALSRVAGPFVPWVGLNVGWEQATVSLSGAAASGSLSMSGYEVGLQVGGDYKLNPQFTVGPYVGYALGQYTSLGLPNGMGTVGIDQTTHGWWSVGVLGQFDM